MHPRYKRALVDLAVCFVVAFAGVGMVGLGIYLEVLS